MIRLQWSASNRLATPWVRFDRATQIQALMDTNRGEYVDGDAYESLIPSRDEMMARGIIVADTAHLEYAISQQCDYFITTDDRILRFKDERINVISPVDLIGIGEERQWQDATKSTP